MAIEEFYSCASTHKVAAICVFDGSYEIDVYSVVPRPFKFGVFKLEKIAKHVFESRDSALESLGWHGVVWFKDEHSEDVIEAASRLFCCEVV